MFRFPQDQEIEACSLDYDKLGNLTGSSHPDNTGWPEFMFDSLCRAVGIGYEDAVFETGQKDYGCYKIIRTWYIADWCGKRPKEEIWWRQPLNHIGTYEQKLVIIDTTPPACTINGPVTNGDTLEASGCTVDMNIEVDIEGGCEGVNLKWELKAIRGTGKLIIHFGEEFITDSIHSIPDLVNIPSGNYILDTRVSDMCGNESTCTYSFLVIHSEKPAISCKSSLTTDLSPVDIDQNGQIDSGLAVVWAKEFDSSSQPACQDDRVEFYIDLLDGVGDDTWKDDLDFLDVGCNYLGEQIVRIWVVSQPSGGVDFCDVLLSVQDNFNACPDSIIVNPGARSEIHMPEVVNQGKFTLYQNEPITFPCIDTTVQLVPSVLFSAQSVKVFS